MFVGIKWISCRFIKFENIILVTLTIAISLSYLGKYMHTNMNSIVEVTARQDTIELFDYIKEETDERSIFIFQKPRVLSLFTERSSSVYHIVQDDDDLLDYFQEIKANYLIVGQDFELDKQYMIYFIERNKVYFNGVFSNSTFKVYKIKDMNLN